MYIYIYIYIYIEDCISEVKHLKVFDICLLDVKSLQINQNSLDAYKNCTKHKTSSLCFR